MKWWTVKVGVLLTGLSATISNGEPGPGTIRSPYPPSPVFAGIELDWSTHRREAQGSDLFQLCWVDNDHQYGFWGDGGGFGGTNQLGRVSLGFARIEGSWNDYRGFNVWGGKDAENPATFKGKSWGTVCIDGVFYSWIVPDEPDSGGPRDHYRYVELARSTDHGATWQKAPWRWYREDELIGPTFLVDGKNHKAAPDSYVYVYFIRPERKDITQPVVGLRVQKPGAIFLARVSRQAIFQGREAYEWFTGIKGNQPVWGHLDQKRPVFEDPNGVGWCLSAIYHSGFQRVLLATEHTESSRGCIGLFDAPDPWGPWTTVEYWTADRPFGDQRPGSSWEWKSNIFLISFAPKWFSPDGREFTLVFTGAGNGRDNDSLNTVRGRFRVNANPLKSLSNNLASPIRRERGQG